MLRLEELEVYMLSIDLAERIWSIVIKWDYSTKKTVGEQLVRSADSIGVNISEGYGRFHYKENKQFFYYSRGSLSETKTWLVKVRNRKLIFENDYQSIFSDLETIYKKLNNYIHSIGKPPTPND